MRKLKFWIWDKDKKKMYLSPSEVEYLGSWFDAHLPGTIANKDNIVIMQHIGLQDKNNRYIYEGDIVSVKPIDEVIWSKITYKNKSALSLLTVLVSKQNRKKMMVVIIIGIYIKTIVR